MPRPNSGRAHIEEHGTLYWSRVGDNGVKPFKTRALFTGCACECVCVCVCVWVCVCVCVCACVAVLCWTAHSGVPAQNAASALGLLWWGLIFHHRASKWKQSLSHGYIRASWWKRTVVVKRTLQTKGFSTQNPVIRVLFSSPLLL